MAVKETTIPSSLDPEIAKRTLANWTATELRAWLKERHGIECSEDTVRRAQKRATDPVQLAKQRALALEQMQDQADWCQARRTFLREAIEKLKELIKLANQPEHIPIVVKAVQVVGELDIAKMAIGGDEDVGKQDPEPSRAAA